MFCMNKVNNFYLSRGDTFKFPIIINKSPTKLEFDKYELSENDIIYGAIIEPNQAFEDALIRKVITIESEKDENNNPLFVLDSDDTEYLLTGKYYITFKLKHNDEITTILPMKEFWITGTNKEVCRCCC